MKRYFHVALAAAALALASVVAPPALAGPLAADNPAVMAYKEAPASVPAQAVAATNVAVTGAVPSTSPQRGAFALYSSADPAVPTACRADAGKGKKKCIDRYRT